jgi:hypothetical protein
MSMLKTQKWCGSVLFVRITIDWAYSLFTTNLICFFFSFTYIFVGKWEWWCCVTLPLQLGTQLPHFLFYKSKTKQKDLQTKRNIQKGILQYIQGKQGTKFPEWLKLVQRKQYLQIYNVWQPSLVLGRLVGALTVSMDCKSPILGLALQAY